MKETEPLAIPRRLRRLRVSRSVRALIQETRLGVDDLIAPLFVHEGEQEREPVESMPEVFRFSLDSAVEECRTLRDLGIKAVAVFPAIAPDRKDPKGSISLDPDNLVYRTVRAIKKALPEMVVVTDVALDPFTSHGHDGLVNEKTGDVDNDATVDVLCRIAVLEAEAGADWVAPSDMMDGRVHAIREALDSAGYTQTSILAYSAKFASGFYGPFRDAIGSKPSPEASYLNKSTYQLNPANGREALQEALLDAEEGADLLMVKPAGPYLDILKELRSQTLLPLVAYQVSGEYSQLHAAARLGWLELERVRDESLTAIKRAGADLVITYFAKQLAQKFNQ